MARLLQLKRAKKVEINAKRFCGSADTTPPAFIYSACDYEVESVSQSVSQSALIWGPHILKKTRGPQSRDGKGSLEGTWSLSPTMIYANTLLLHQLDPKSRQIPILFKRYPSSLPSLCNELVFPDTPLASVLRRPVPIYVLALRELRQRVLPSQDWPPPASPAPDRLPIH